MTLLNWTERVDGLRKPVLLIALEGFVDAGAVASTAAAFLRHRFKSDVVATFDRDAFIDYRARRPTVVVDSGELRRVDWPDIELCAARIDGPSDALLLLGPEPDMRWEAFARVVGDLCAEQEVSAVVSLGAYPAAVPHTRPPTLVRAHNGAGAHLADSTSGVAGYTGPVGVGSVLQVLLGDRGVPAVGLWVEVPHYISASPHPEGALAMVRRVAELLRVTVDTTELEAAAISHRRQVDEAVAEHHDAAEMVKALEHHVDAGEDEEDLPSGEDLAHEIERFLRTQRDG